MTLSIEIPPDLEVELAAQAQAEGISPEIYLRRILEQQLTLNQPGGHPKSSYGILAQHGPPSSAEEIAENRADNTESQQVDSVIGRATEVFANRQKALRWLGTPVRALEYATPISLLSRPDGSSAVLTVLDKIEHGVL